MARTLRNKGRLCICHLQSRDDINNLYIKLDLVVSKGYLLNLETIRDYFDNEGLYTTK